MEKKTNRLEEFMVIDKLMNSNQYESLHPGVVKAFGYLRGDLGRTLPAGRYDIDGDEVYAMVQEYETEPEGNRQWESHRKYLDVQYVISGREAMLYAPVGSLVERGGYLDEKDFQGYQDGPGTALRCEEGTFVLFWPQDIHKPCCRLDGSVSVKKIVVKVRL